MNVSRVANVWLHRAVVTLLAPVQFVAVACAFTWHAAAVTISDVREAWKGN